MCPSKGGLPLFGPGIEEIHCIPGMSRRLRASPMQCSTTGVAKAVVCHIVSIQYNAGHNLTGIASQFAMHLGFICDVISVTHRSD